MPRLGLIQRSGSVAVSELTPLPLVGEPEPSRKPTACTTERFFFRRGGVVDLLLKIGVFHDEVVPAIVGTHHAESEFHATIALGAETVVARASALATIRNLGWREC